MSKNKIIQFNFDYTVENHPNIKGLQIIEGKNNFPISWLNQQGYCEYSLYLEHFEGITTAPTIHMVKGDIEHKKLEDKFKEDATPATFEEVLDSSKDEKAVSREIFVSAPKFGIRGFIDEIWMTPEEFVIIDDKPGTIAYSSTIHQVQAYCLAFKSMIGNDKRKIKGALRERGTSNIFWMENFDENNERNIKFLINRMHGLFNQIKPFLPTKNPNKCRSCRFNKKCQHAL